MGCVGAQVLCCGRFCAHRVHQNAKIETHRSLSCARLRCRLPRYALHRGTVALGGAGARCACKVREGVEVWAVLATALPDAEASQATTSFRRPTTTTPQVMQHQTEVPGG